MDRDGQGHAAAGGRSTRYLTQVSAAANGKQQLRVTDVNTEAKNAAPNFI